MFRLWFSFLNNRRTNVLLVGIFENAQKKVMDRQKRHFGSFWRLITVFCAFSKILIKITFVRLLLLKLKCYFGSFWWLITVFCAFSKILIKITFVRLLFLKLKQKKNMKNNFFTFFFKTQKCPFLRGYQFLFINFFSVLRLKH